MHNIYCYRRIIFRRTHKSKKLFYLETPTNYTSVLLQMIIPYVRDNGGNDRYSQPGIFYSEVLDAEKKKALVANISGALKSVSGPNPKP